MVLCGELTAVQSAPAAASCAPFPSSLVRLRALFAIGAPGPADSRNGIPTVSIPALRRLTAGATAPVKARVRVRERVQHQVLRERRIVIESPSKSRSRPLVAQEQAASERQRRKPRTVSRAAETHQRPDLPLFMPRLEPGETHDVSDRTNGGHVLLQQAEEGSRIGSPGPACSVSPAVALATTPILPRVSARLSHSSARSRSSHAPGRAFEIVPDVPPPRMPKVEVLSGAFADTFAAYRPRPVGMHTAGRRRMREA